MPHKFNQRAENSLTGKALQYQLLFPYKQDDSKQIFKALRKDEQTGLQQEVLLKIFLDEKKSYFEEFESLSQVVSPYCVRLLGFEIFSEKKALVLEYINGVSLFQLIENFSLNEKEQKHILISIYRGLEDLRKEGLCHGDLSLDNVLIDEQAQIKLIDFGKANYEQETQGTIPFISPELLQGARASFSSDLYSLGVIEILLRHPLPLSSLKNLKIEEFNKKIPLLHLDPQKRFFPYSKKLSMNYSKEDLNSLKYKVKDLISCMDARRCKTLKNIGPSLSLSCFVKRFCCICFLVFFSAVSSNTYLIKPSLLKIYTNDWFAIQIGSFHGYTPLNLPLKSGWHSITWSNRKETRKMKVFIPKGEDLFLSDKNFFESKKIPEEKISS